MCIIVKYTLFFYEKKSQFFFRYFYFRYFSICADRCLFSYIQNRHECINIRSLFINKSLERVNYVHVCELLIFWLAMAVQILAMHNSWSIRIRHTTQQLKILVGKMVDKQPVSFLRKSWGMRKKKRLEKFVTNTCCYSLDIGEDLS